jgi:flagellar protein FliL
MKRVLIALLAIAILGGGGAAWFYFKPALAAIGGESGEHAKAAKKSGGHGESDKEEPKYVHVDPLTLPIIDDHGVSSNVSIVIEIEVKNTSDVEPVRKQLPRLVDAYIQDMYGILNKRAALKDGVVQVGMVKQRLNAITKRMLGEDVVGDVLLQVVSQRAL